MQCLSDQQSCALPAFFSLFSFGHPSADSSPQGADAQKIRRSLSSLSSTTLSPSLGMKPLRPLRALFQPHYVYRPAQLFRRLYREWFCSTPASAIASLPWKHSLQVLPTEHIGRSVWLHGIYGTTVCEILWRLSETGMTVVDAGANIGVMTSLLAHRVHPNGSVYSFEPHPTLYDRLLKNVDRFRQQTSSSLHPLPHALHNRSGTAYLTFHDTFKMNQGLASLTDQPCSGHEIRVSCVPLDALFPSAHLNILKVDVEGHESQVLTGAENLLSDGRIDYVLYECHDGPYAALHDLLSQHGYSLFGIRSSIRGPILLPFADLSSTTPDLNSSFLATRHPTDAEALVRPDGWNCLTCRN